MTLPDGAPKTSSLSLDVPECDVQVVNDGRQSSRMLKARIRGKLAENDPEMAAMWDIVTEVGDTNEQIRVVLQQMHLFFQEATETFWRHKAENKQYLERMLDAGPEAYGEFSKERRRLADEAEKDRKHLTDLAKTIKQLGTEYRQCALQKRYSLPIALVVAFKTAMESAIWRHITDDHVKQAIAEDIREATRALSSVGPEDEG